MSEKVFYVFGSKEFFIEYMKNQIEKEGGAVTETVHRIHFSLSQFIFENFNGKIAMSYVKNLTEAGEELTQYRKSVSYIE